MQRFVPIFFAAVVVMGLGLWWMLRAPAPVISPTLTDTNQATTTPSAATTTSGSTPTTPKKPTANPVTISPKDTNIHWDTTDLVTHDQTQQDKAKAEIVRFNGLLNTGAYTNYELYVSIATEYDKLGDGMQSFTYLKKALAIDSTNTGLAWNNLGSLLTAVGAYHTAKTAYENAVKAQPDVGGYSQALQDFLNRYGALAQ